MGFPSPLQSALEGIKEYLRIHPMRVDFHPDHFVVLNTSDKDVLKNSIKDTKYA